MTPPFDPDFPRASDPASASPVHPAIDNARLPPLSRWFALSEHARAARRRSPDALDWPAALILHHLMR